MISQIYNPLTQRVERLSFRGTYLQISSQFVIAGQNFDYALDRDRTYQINKMTAMLGIFEDPMTPVRSYPNYEQFWLKLNANAYIANAAGQRYKELFQNFHIDFTNGSPCNIVFEQPYIFKTDSSISSILTIAFTDDSSYLSDVTGIPPAGDVLYVFGNLYLEGVSWGTTTKTDTDFNAENTFDENYNIPSGELLD